MEEYEDYLKQRREEPGEPGDAEELIYENSKLLGGGHFTIRSKLKPINLQDFGSKHNLSPQDSNKFRSALGDFMSKSLQDAGIQLPDNLWIKFPPTHIVSTNEPLIMSSSHEHTKCQITPFQYLKVNYESYETWRVATDFLRCNPRFQNQPRYDFVIFRTENDGLMFAQLKHLFTCAVGAEKYAVAYVQSYKVVAFARRSRSDKALGILRVKRDKMEFVSVHSVIRGALLVATTASDVLEEERLVVDTIDYDMFLRVKKHWPGYTDN
ncbi:hypothetical protein E1B28_012040 [Marasmius oreades]|uniref:Uncharacterized protein n=1 Tax=Marasmius oreades TaxID=181124 RepID=A0A9P7RQN2_9AGAR|nr:uncharacterized protein E1B28_012040 [Marasmius oreades]KAG7088001.1 hypothetical protein E1B28_012040 [Marasmius oreades]